MEYKSFMNGWQGIWWGFGFICVDRVIVKENFFFSGLYSNVVCFYKRGISKYFNIQVFYDKIFKCKVCVVVGEGCLQFFDYLKLRGVISLLNGLGI